MRTYQRLVSAILLLCGAAIVSGQTQPVSLSLPLNPPFHFVAYGDIRFTSPKDTEASNPEVRKVLVQAIADARPAFIAISGDLPYKGDNGDDWKVFDTETAVWQNRNIPVYPALGNHELVGDEKIALGNYFQRFPNLKNSRYYSLLAGNLLLLALDSSVPETSGPQGQWLGHELDTVPAGVDFVLVLLHHPPFTSSADHMPGGGHSARPVEQGLAKLLEDRQQHLRARIVVVAGHVHNYERHEHGGITYLVSGGGGAHPYMIERVPGDLFTGRGINYHYLLVEVDRGRLTFTMNRVELTDGKPSWTQPDSVTIHATEGAPAKVK